MVGDFEKEQKWMQHRDFPGGHPSQYYSGPKALNFRVLMGSGVVALVWPHHIRHRGWSDLNAGTRRPTQHECGSPTQRNSSSAGSIPISELSPPPSQPLLLVQLVSPTHPPTLEWSPGRSIFSPPPFLFKENFGQVWEGQGREGDVCSTRELGGWREVTNRWDGEAESQWIVAARLLYHLQYLVPYLSRLQRIHLPDRLKL